MATITTIAREAGVSPAVVSRIVNCDASLRVSRATRERVEKIIQKLDYSPHAAARSLRSAKSGMLALVMHNLANPVNASIVGGAQGAAARLGKCIILGEASKPGECSHVEDLIGGGGVDGLILQGAATEMDRALSRAARRKIPTVLLQSGKSENATLVEFENRKAAWLATSHLIELGHRRIGILDVDKQLEFSRERVAGWKDALLNSGIQPEPSWHGTGGSHFADGAQGIENLVGAAEGLTAAVSSNVISGIGALARLADMEIAVPGDFSLVAIHDSELAGYVRPSLTTVRTPLKHMGETAVEEVCSRSGGHARRIAVREPSPSLEIRMSAGPPR